MEEEHRPRPFLAAIYPPKAWMMEGNTMVLSSFILNIRPLMSSEFVPHSTLASSLLFPADL